MTHIVFDPGLLARLEESRDPLDLCDQSGRILGTFYPRAVAVDYEALERARPKLPPDEVERRRRGPTYSTDEAIKYLESQ
jgi:hypothetical protein